MALRSTRPLAPLWLALVAFATVWLSSPTPAGAHANIESSSPSNGEVLADPIDHVTIDFGEEISDAVQMFLRWEGADGEIEQIGGTVTKTDPTIARLDFPLLEREGTYFVNYIGPVPADGHVITGAIGFVYGTPTVFVSDDPNVKASTPVARQTIQEPISEVEIEFAAALENIRFFFAYDEGDGENITPIPTTTEQVDDVTVVVSFDELETDGTYILSYLAEYPLSDEEVGGDIPFFLGAPSSDSGSSSFPWLAFAPIALIVLGVGAWFSWRRMLVDDGDGDGDGDGDDDDSGHVDEDLADVGV